MPGPKAPQKIRREQIVNAAYEVALREGIDGVSLRAVAARAKLSHGLLLFHFKQKDQLIAALLDRVLTTAAMLRTSDDLTRLPPSPNRLTAVLRKELDDISREPDTIRLFFEYWALGVRDSAIRQKIGAALERYRAAFRSLAADALPPDATGGASITPDALAAIAVSLISGCAVQAMIDPDRFDNAGYLAAVHTIVERLAAEETGGPGRN